MIAFRLSVIQYQKGQSFQWGIKGTHLDSIVCYFALEMLYSIPLSLKSTLFRKEVTMYILLLIIIITVIIYCLALNQNIWVILER